MAVNSITFGGVNSADFGIYISGEGVFNAPKRDVEMIKIPGRNGAFALDNGRFENIEVTYPAFNFEPDDYDTFMQNLSDFRNAICSQRGYQRLTDTFHPDEYRMATYIGGLEIKPVKYNTASEFNIVFDCKPQRWLTSGETKTSVSSGSTVTNPTLFEASPLLECKGYGNINLNGETITITAVPIGNVLLSNGASFSVENAEQTAYHDPAEIGSIALNLSNFNAGDDIYVAESVVTYNISVRPWSMSGTSVSSETGESWTTSTAIPSPLSAYFRTAISPQTFKKGTASTKTYEYMLHFEMDSGSVTVSSLVTIKIAYDGNQTIKLYASTFENTNTETYKLTGSIGQVDGFSTVVADETFYIDLEIGEAYYIHNNVYSSANYAVSIPAKLPTFAPGTNTITYTNTITNFKITPRWWKI